MNSVVEIHVDMLEKMFSKIHVCVVATRLKLLLLVVVYLLKFRAKYSQVHAVYGDACFKVMGEAVNFLTVFFVRLLHAHTFSLNL